MTTQIVSAVELKISQFIAKELGVPQDEIEADRNLGTYGLSSVSAVKLVGILEDEFRLKLSPTLVFEHPTIARLAMAIAGERELLRRH